MEIDFRSERINYYGRTDVKEDGVYCYFPSTSAEVHFKGTEIYAKFSADIVGELPLSAMLLTAEWAESLSTGTITKRK